MKTISEDINRIKSIMGIIYESLETNDNISIGSWVRTKTEEFQVIDIEDNIILGKSFCDPDKISKINRDEIINVEDSTKNKMMDIKNSIQFDFSKYHQLAGLNEIVNLPKNIRPEREKYLKGKKTILFLDDTRNPYTSKVDWISKFSNIGTDDVYVEHIETMSQFINHITNHGLPEAVIFDNDLGKKDKEGGSGCLSASWLVKYCIDNNFKLPKWSIVSANKYGRCCISSILRKFESLYGN